MFRTRAIKALTLACVVLTCPVAAPVAATEAIQSLVVLTGTNIGWGVISDGGAGFAFKPATNLYVNALGYLFATNYTSWTNAAVELLDSWGNVRASATLTTNSPQTGGWSYASIPAIFLPAKSTNYIVAYDPAEYAASHTKAWAGAYVENGTNSTWFAAAPELLYLGPVNGTELIGDPEFYLIGANFQFTTAPAAPALRIVLTRTNTVVLSWPTQAAVFNLQATTNLFSWPATNFPTPPVVSGTNNVLVLPPAGRRTFFRLIQ